MAERDPNTIYVGQGQAYCKVERTGPNTLEIAVLDRYAQVNGALRFSGAGARQLVEILERHAKQMPPLPAGRL